MMKQQVCFSHDFGTFLARFKSELAEALKND